QVEMGGEGSPLVLNSVDHAHACRDAGALEALREQQREPLLVARGHQNLESQWSTTLAIDQLRAAQVVAGACKQVERALERCSVAAGPVADRRRPGAIKYVGTHRLGKRRKQRSLPVIGRSPMRRQLRVIEKARASPVEIEEVTVVDPFEVE